MVGAIIFLILASGTIQPWAIEKSKMTMEPDVVDQKKDSVDQLIPADFTERKYT